MGIFSFGHAWGHGFPHRGVPVLGDRPTGFSLVEILVASCISAIFGCLVFQGMGLASIIQARAIQKAEAAGWVRDDLENLRQQAANLAFNQNFCRPAAADKGWAAALASALGGEPDSQLPTLNLVSTTGRNFQIVRQTEVSAEPYNVLGLRYQVQPLEGPSISAPIYEFYTEVIPDAAFQCP
jgi:type II secretory pathway pseudopilin PulG